MSTELDAALDELYGVAPAEFVLVRSRLERELKAAGDTEAAADIHRRRRPHLAAWACNQLARREPDAIDELFDATAHVAAAQHAAVSGGSADELRDATRARQEIIESLTDTALRLLAGQAPKPAQYRDNIATTLDAATLDGAAGEELRAGRLTQPMLAPAGFGPLDGAPAVATPNRERKPSAREIEKARREVDKARRTADEVTAAVDEADAGVTSAQLRAESAAAHVGEVGRALERAQEAATEANLHVGTAREAAETARRAARDAHARLEEAQARLAQLEAG